MSKKLFLGIVVIVASVTLYATTLSNSTLMPAEKFVVTQVPADNGTYSIEPRLPADGKVDAGTELTITAKPANGYSLDAIYYTVKGGMWGTTSFEKFSSPMKIKVAKDMLVGATFVDNALVENINETQDVIYAQPGAKALKYDVFSPKGARNLPGIVIIHGGGWSSNNEDIMRGLARELVKGGRYVVFSIDYRWVNKLDGDAEPNYMHKLIEDVFGAIAHIQEHAAKYGLDPTRLAVTGDSAGGHLSASAATLSPMIGDGGFGKRDGVYEYMPTYVPREKTITQVKKEIVNGVKAVAPSYGPSHASEFKQFVEQTDNAYWDAISPLKHIPNVSDRALPHFIVRGEEDPVITHEMIQRYEDALKTAGQQVTYIPIAGAGHAFFDWKPDSETRSTFAKYGVKYAEEMRKFFDGVFYSR